MAILASILQLASIKVSLGLFLGFPEFALIFAFVIVQARLASEVLPVVCVLTLVALMILVLIIERAPDCLEMEHVEVCILLHFMQEIYVEFFFRVSERAQIAEFAILHTVREAITELALVFLRVVEVFHSVMRLCAVVLLRAIIVSIRAQF